MKADALKKNQEPLICYFRLYGEDKRRMLALTGGRRGHHNIIALAGTIARMAQLEAEAGPASPAELKTLAWFRRITGKDPIEFLKASAKAHIPLPAFCDSAPAAEHQGGARTPDKRRAQSTAQRCA